MEVPGDPMPSFPLGAFQRACLSGTPSIEGQNPPSPGHTLHRCGHSGPVPWSPAWPRHSARDPPLLALSLFLGPLWPALVSPQPWGLELGPAFHPLPSPVSAHLPVTVGTASRAGMEGPESSVVLRVGSVADVGTTL